MLKKDEKIWLIGIISSGFNNECAKGIPAFSTNVFKVITQKQLKCKVFMPIQLGVSINLFNSNIYNVFPHFQQNIKSSIVVFGKRFLKMLKLFMET